MGRDRWRGREGGGRECMRVEMEEGRGEVGGEGEGEGGSLHVHPTDI